MTPLNWRRSAGATLLVLVAVLEVWALGTPMVRNLQVDLLGWRSARDLSIMLDLFLVVPVALFVLALVWGQPAWLPARVAPVLVAGRRFARSLGWMLLIPLCYAAIRALPLPAGTMLMVIVVVEAAFLVLLVGRIVRLSRLVRLHRSAGYSFVTALLQAAASAFNSLQLKLVLRLVIIEFALLVYGLVGWFLPRTGRGSSFTNHRRDDNTVFIALALFITVEAIPVHFLVHHYSVWAAWILTVLHVYSLLWLFGDIAARRHRPSILTDSWLRLTYGLRGEVVIRLADVRSVRLMGEIEAEARVGTGCQLLFVLAAPTSVFGWFGREKQANVIAAGVDEPVRLLAELELAGVPVEIHEEQAIVGTGN